VPEGLDVALASIAYMLDGALASVASSGGGCRESRSVAAMDWRHRAACRDEDPELFFPIGTSGPALLQVEQAKAVCRRCTVADNCLQWALETGQDAGVWGGMSEEERRAVKRRSGLRVRAHSL
jgi:WhiB family redox-sensing transcriptional regulator